MKIHTLKLTYIFLASILLLSGCKKDDYDGLNNIDPVPANAVTFPDATVNGFTLMDDNAFIIEQNAVANGKVEVRIKGPSSKQITNLEVKAQRFRGTIVAPNVSPTAPTSADSRAPSAFNRTIAPLEKVAVTPSSEVVYSVNLSALPPALTKATLGPVAVPTNAQYDVFRFYFIVTYDDGTSMVSNEVRVVVKG
jgi:hypothetical protein